MIHSLQISSSQELNNSFISDDENLFSLSVNNNNHSGNDNSNFNKEDMNDTNSNNNNISKTDDDTRNIPSVLKSPQLYNINTLNTNENENYYSHYCFNNNDIIYDYPIDNLSLLDDQTLTDHNDRNNTTNNDKETISNIIENSCHIPRYENYANVAQQNYKLWLSSF